MLTALFRYLRKKKSEWDSHCLRCGLCCYEKETGNNGTVYIDLRAPCPYLNTETKLCRVYERRLKVCRECRRVTLYHALLAGYMPEGCGYVRRYRPKRRKHPVLRS